MEGDLGALASAVRALSERVTQLERRLAAVERGSHTLEPEPAVPAVTELGQIAAAPQVARAPETLSLVGRTLVVLAGAFLLRAITGAKLLPDEVGAAIGIAYAIWWLVTADRTAARGRLSSAAFHGFAAAIIAFPLFLEVTLKFHFLSPTVAALALTATTLLALAIAWHRSLPRLAWLFSLGAVPTALALAVGTKTFMPFIACLVLLGFVTLWLGYARDWLGLAAVMAGVVDLTLLILALLLLLGPTEQVARIYGPVPLIALQLVLLVGYASTFLWRSISRGETLGPFEVSQVIAATVVGLGGTVAVVRATHVAALPLGLVSLALAAACYAVAFTFSDRHAGNRTNFIVYSTLALTFTCVGCAELLEGAALAAALAVAALSIAWLGGRRQRATLSLHGAVYLLAAAITAGVLRGALEALFHAGALPDPWMSAVGWLVLGVAAACAWMPVAIEGKTWGRFSRVTKLVHLTVLLLGAGGVLVTAGADLLPRTPEGAPDAGALASLRTAILSVSALVVAGLGRIPRLAEAGWLLYPVLIAGGLKFLTEELRAGRPATLVISLAFFGGALIVAPRLARRAN